jgi:hypothetical protein
MSKRQEAGRRHEQDVDFHLHRGMKGEKNIHLFHDVKFEVDGETAQIDHLVLHKYGFILIESKCVYGEISVNANNEWSRSFKNQWYGIPSPIAQAEAQKVILKQALLAATNELLGKLFGVQKGFGGRRYDVLVAISSSAIIHRADMPEDVDNVTFKSEFLAAQVRALIFSYSGGWLLPNEVSFTEDEMTAIGDFLQRHQQTPCSSATTPSEAISEHADHASPAQDKTATTTPVVVPIEKDTAPATPSQPTTWAVACKHCQNTTGLSGQYGRWGYYTHCSQCEKNTPLKTNCVKCKGTETRVNKKRNVYTLNCSVCGDVGQQHLA